MIYHRHATAFEGCCYHEGVEIHYSAHAFYRRHALVQQFQYFLLAELGHCSIKVCVVGDIIAGMEETPELLWMILHVVLQGQCILFQWINRKNPVCIGR